MSDKAYRKLPNGKMEMVYAEDEILRRDGKEQEYYCCGQDPTGKVCNAVVRLRSGPYNEKTKKKGEPNFYQPWNASNKHIAGCPHDERKATKDIFIVDNDISKLIPADLLEKWSRPSKETVVIPKGGDPGGPPKGNSDKVEIEEDEREVEEKFKKITNLQELYAAFEKNELDASTQDGRTCKDWVINGRTYLDFRKSGKLTAAAIALVKKSSYSELNTHLIEDRGKNTIVCTVMDTSSSNGDTRIYFSLCLDQRELNWDKIMEIKDAITKRTSDWLVFANWERYEVGGKYKDCVVYKGLISNSKQIAELKR